jgi:hypothetical protein
MVSTIGKTGGCQCGSIRYQLSGEAKMLYACHCRDCQKQSSSAFGMSLIIARENLRLSKGGETLRSWDTRGDDGEVKRCYFCPDCGSRIYHGSERDDADISIKAGSLDDTGWLRPVAHIWLHSAQPWITIGTEGYACFSREPTDQDELAQRWREQCDSS